MAAPAPAGHGGGVRRAASLPLILLLAGCPQAINTLEDAGADAGVSREDAAAPDSGDPGTPDSGVGAEDAGAPDPDAGPRDAGEAPAGFAWTRLGLPANIRGVYAVWGRSRSEVYFGTANGILYRFDPAQGVNQIWRTPGNLDIVAIWGTPTRMFVADRTNLYVSDDSFATSPTGMAVGQAIGGMHGLSDQLVFLVSERTSSRGLFRYDGARIQEVAPDLVTASVNAVLVEPGPQVRIAGNGRIILYDGVGTMDEAAMWPAGWDATDIAYFFIYDLVATNAGRLAVGTGGGILSDAAGSWSFMQEPAGSDDLKTVATAGPGATLAAGEPIQNHPIWWLGPQGWRPDPYQANEVFWDAWFADRDQVFVVGFPRGELGGVVLRGQRAP
jgi:hypothetical protein